MRVDGTSYEESTTQILSWARAQQSRYVCVANVHMTMESYDSPVFRRIVNGADIVTPDGMPLVWALRLMGNAGQQRVYGPDLTLHVCAAAELEGVPVALYGGTTESLNAFAGFLRGRFPSLEIASQIAPPFRPLTPEEDEENTQRLIECSAGVVFVGIGCPKQEEWMAAHKGQIPAVMIGVGAAFDFHSGRVRQAPNWMQRLGLEWLFRLMMEPRRLWRRYLKNNPRFLLYFGLERLGVLRRRA